WWGKAWAVVVIGVGLFLLFDGATNPSLLILGLFLFIAAGKEQSVAAYIFLRYLTRKQREIELKGYMPSQQLVTLETTPLRELMRSFVPQKYHLVWVIDRKGRVQGLAT